MPITQKQTVKRKKVGSYFENMPFTKRHLFVGSVLFVTFVIEAWELMIIIFVAGDIGTDFNLTSLQVGSIIGATALGMIPGAYLWGLVTDKIGRKNTMIYSYLLFGILSLIGAFSLNFVMLYILRILAGVAISGALVACFPYFEELLPVKTRGKAAVYLSGGWPLGTLLAIGVTALLSHMGGFWGGWRPVVVISSLVVLWVLMLKKIPESPYWLTGKSRQKEAKNAINYLSMGHVKVEDETELFVLDFKQGNYLEIFRKEILKTTIVSALIFFTSNFAYWGLLTWMPTLLQQKGLSFSSSLGFLALSSLSQIPGYIVASLLTGKFGRKKIMALFVIFAVIFGYAFAFSSTMFQLYVFNFALSFFLLGLSGIWNTWSAEIFPSNIRGAGVSFGIGAQRWAAALAPSIIGLVIGVGWVFGVTVSFIIFFLVITLILLTFLKETEGRILE